MHAILAFMPRACQTLAKIAPPVQISVCVILISTGQVLLALLAAAVMEMFATVMRIITILASTARAVQLVALPTQTLELLHVHAALGTIVSVQLILALQ